MGKEITVYHNTRCRKSREACSILEERGKAFEVVEYLKTPLTQKEIKDLLKKLGLKAEDIIRKGETVFKENYKGKTILETEWLKILADNPILIERPIIVKGDKAVIGRPPEKVLDLLK